MNIHMNQLEQKYFSLFSKLERVKKDNEAAHILQDRIYRKFIKDICNNEFASLKDVEKMAIDIKTKVVKYDKARWYA